MQEINEQPSRKLKVYGTSGYKYKPTPTIILKGDWIKEWGFDSEVAVNVECQGDGKLIITVEN